MVELLLSQSRPSIFSDRLEELFGGNFFECPIYSMYVDKERLETDDVGSFEATIFVLVVYNH